MIYVYKKKNTHLDVFEGTLWDLQEKYGDDYMLYQDNCREFIHYERMKEALKKRDVVLIKSVESIAMNVEGVVGELEWFQKKGIPLMILQYQSTCTDNVENNGVALQTVREVYESFSEKKNIVLKQDDEIPKVGRKRIEFPDNWDELYAQWKSRKITAKEFMDSTGLKRGTFYHLASNYEEYLAENVKVLKKLPEGWNDIVEQWADGELSLEDLLKDNKMTAAEFNIYLAAYSQSLESGKMLS